MMKTELLGFNTITFDIRKDTLSVTCGGSTFESDYNKITDKTEKELKKLLKTFKTLLNIIWREKRRKNYLKIRLMN